MASVRRNVIASILFVLLGGPGILLFFRAAVDHAFPPASGRTRLAGLLCGNVNRDRFDACTRIGKPLHFRRPWIPVAPPEHPVVIGFYRFVRNPMYVGVMLALTGEAILFHRRGIVSELLWACVGFNLLIWLHEKPSLTRRYPVEYLLYKKAGSALVSPALTLERRLILQID